MEQQLELPFETIRVRSIDELRRIQLSTDIVRIDLNDLFQLSDALFMRGEYGLMTGSKDRNMHLHLSQLMVGRVTEMTQLQKRKFQSLIAHLAVIFPAKQRPLQPAT